MKLTEQPQGRIVIEHNGDYYTVQRQSLLSGGASVETCQSYDEAQQLAYELLPKYGWWWVEDRTLLDGVRAYYNGVEGRAWTAPNEATGGGHWEWFPLQEANARRQAAGLPAAPGASSEEATTPSAEPLFAQAIGEAADDTPRDKAALLARIDKAWAELDHLLDTLSEEQLGGPRDASGWAVKDHLVHLRSWEQSLLALLQGRDRTAAMGLDASYESEEAINARIYERERDRPLAEVLTGLVASHEQLMAMLVGLTDEDIFRPYSHYQPNDPGDGDERPVVGWIIGNSYDHYLEHITWIRALLSGATTPPT